MNITPEKITSLRSNEILVFWSNLAGRHWLWLAKEAIKYWAKYGQGIWLSWQTYALPTKNENIKTLSLFDIRKYVDQLYETIKTNPDYHFLITKVGCWLAWYKPEQIKPLFYRFLWLDNISLPREFLFKDFPDSLNKK